MEISEKISILYLTSFSVVIGSLIAFHLRSQLRWLSKIIWRPFVKHFIYQRIVHSEHFCIQWSRADALAEILYLGLHIFLVWFRSDTLVTASGRAANLCIINLIFLCANPHLDALTNTLGLHWGTVRRLHGSVGLMATFLLIFHVVICALSQDAFPMAVPKNAWAVVVSSLIEHC